MIQLSDGFKWECCGRRKGRFGITISFPGKYDNRSAKAVERRDEDEAILKDNEPRIL